jgi:SPP1 family predicted phage head-tail adaptor
MTGPIINPGALNRWLTLEAPVEADDGSGGVTRNYEAAATLWASIEPVAARETVAAGALCANVTHRIRIRFSSDITLRHRFRDGDAIYRFAALRVRDKRFLDIDAELRVE